jgi:hypothetical protein
MRSCLLICLTLAIAACETALEVQNDNAPDRERVLSEASDVETLIGGSFLLWFQATEGCAAWLTAVAADVTTVSWTRCGGLQVSQEPREPWPNNPNSIGSELEEPWDVLYELLASVRDGVLALDADIDGRFDQQIDVPRARAFAKFTQGLAHGYLAMLWDSAYVWDETVDAGTNLARQPYPAVLRAALVQLDDAITLASGADWSLDPSWLRERPLSADQFMRLVHGYKARFMSQVARTPTERANLDWSSIIAEVDNNLGEDFEVVSDAQQWWPMMIMWSDPWWNPSHRADYKLVGYADTGGRYQEWLASDAISRDQFELLTPDARLPANMATPGTDFVYFPSGFPSPEGQYYQSSYLHSRYADFILNFPGGGPIKLMSQDAQQLIKAEGLYWQDRLDEAATIVNVTRVGRRPAAATRTSWTN